MNFSRNIVSWWVALVLALVSLPAFAQVSISVDIAPPPLVVEEQPVIPGDGYIWTPGYWSYDQDQGAYYWVEGAWVQPPEVGLLWTPGYWGWANNDYVYNPGYWGPTVGFYGGVNYGHGYWGNGYGGGRWDNGHFAYNREANNISNAHIQNVYNDRAGFHAQSNRASFNGGRGGIAAQPTSEQRQAMQQNHVQATAQQQSHLQMAAQSRSHEVKVNSHNAAAANAPAQSGAANPQPSAGQQQFTGERKNDRTADGVKAPAQQQAQPSRDGQAPAGEQKFTGENAQDRNKEKAADNTVKAPVQHQPETSPVTRAPAEQQVTGEAQKEHAPAQANIEQHQAPQVEHTSPVQHMAPAESHAAPGPVVHQGAPSGPGNAPHSAAPAPHVAGPASAPAGHPEAAQGGPGPDAKHP